MLKISKFPRFRVTSIRLAGGGDNPKPTWSIPRGQRMEPQIPDRFYYNSHWFLRADQLCGHVVRRVQFVIGDSFLMLWGDIKQFATKTFDPIVSKYLPGLNHKISFIISSIIAGRLVMQLIGGTYATDKGKIESALALRDGKRLEDEGFWMTTEEEKILRQMNYETHAKKLNDRWEAALQSATEHRSFAELCKFISPEGDVGTNLPPKFIPKFELIPYGEDNPQTSAFPLAKFESQGQSMQEWVPSDSGTYVQRKDNKWGPMRRARWLYADVYIPPTK
eukprot:GHVR01168620.1.p1 GENE.GHVR01168620.1~~GHVR01168620.1.p1  ORF type:complete len:286 (-),score=29.93 GHVR01168620.1:325-1158(-)